MDKPTESRKVTRNTMWPDTTAILCYRTRYGEGSTSLVEISARVENLNAKGMFVLVDRLIAIDNEIEIKIEFNEKISLEAVGKVLRSDESGVAVEFTKIDTTKLCNCIMDRMNFD